MRITLKLFATFRNGRFKVAEQELPDGTEVRAVVLSLGLTEEEIGIVMLNGRHGELDSKLADQDTLSLFPLVGGG
ncbi:Tungsten-containing aldehyde:ferredoxin oxidoreductase cofactor synthesis sulfur carrier protein [Citrifermentans bremense]|uniref:Tungsten-containing aldehyde:ferredoxin oxidoreductase cofactor synthesis sulfur carrier protein n=1 Tax=Citrifermentans bremense TaxID=60035 RepID=A0A6S6M865_9BACT|nr:MoaD/ThiS family protein [Citrifermentans bremense]BCG48026.1 Tungsten-containing aldehyde:ferredoxin oxidoreductase cofactor synthesis sulfur carrier protein [Citrifermentans bremense]